MAAYVPKCAGMGGLDIVILFNKKALVSSAFLFVRKNTANLYFTFALSNVHEKSRLIQLGNKVEYGR